MLRASDVIVDSLIMVDMQFQAMRDQKVDKLFGVDLPQVEWRDPVELEEPAPEPDPEPKFIDDMTLADYRRGVAKVFDSYRLF